MAVSFSRKDFVLRARLILVFVFLAFFILLYNFYNLQVLMHDYYKYAADRQYARNYEYYDRGSIFFTKKDGEYSAVANVQIAYALAIDPSRIKNPEQTYRELVKLALNIEKDLFIKKASNKKARYREILKGLDKDTATKIKSKKIPGVIVSKYRYRFYPASALACHTIGFVAQSANDSSLRGRYGLEKYYDETLFKDPQDIGVNFFAELFGGFKDLTTGKSYEKGSIISTIEPIVQSELEKTLRKTRKRWSSKRVSGIVYNPNSGEIIAMASYPDFDLNNFSKVHSVAEYENPLVENVYEMGSIVKAITVASGIDSGSIKESDRYYDSGCKVYNKSKICNYDKKARHTVPVQEILSQSLNVGAAWVYEKMGKKKFKGYFEKLGLLESSGIDLPNEAEPLVSNLDSPRDIEFATASFGQGVAFTPVAMVRALGALGTGYVHTPHVVKYIKKDTGILINVAPKDESAKVFKDSSVEAVSRMLTEVVDTKLDNGKRKKERYSVAAKTGTAQVSGGDGRYIKDVYNHTFFGYFPSFEPKFVVLLINERPVGAKYSSQTLADPFYEMVDFLINYYNIEPDR